MVNQRLQLGFVGGSLQSAVGTTHKIACQMDDRWELVSACFSTDSISNTSTADAWGVARDRLYASWKELLTSERGHLDAIVVLTPTPSHAEIVITALQLGFAVICEKAMAVSSEEAKQISDAVKKYNGFLAVTYNYTGYPMIRELQNLIKSGELGAINQIHIEMPQEGFLRVGKDDAKPVPQAWRLHDDSVPTVSLDLGVHLHHMIDFLCGQKPIELVAVNNCFGHFDGVVDNTMCIARYTGNVDCQIWFGKTALGKTNGLRVQIYGESGSAEWVQMSPEIIELNDTKGRKIIIERSSVDVKVSDLPRYNRFKAGHPAGFLEAFANYYYDIADSLIEFKATGEHTVPWVIGVDQAYEGLLMLEAIADSVKSKSWKKVAAPIL